MSRLPSAAGSARQYARCRSSKSSGFIWRAVGRQSVDDHPAFTQIIERAIMSNMAVFFGDGQFCLLHGVRIERDALCPHCVSSAPPLTDEQRRKFIQSAASSALKVQAESDATEIE